MQFSTSPTPSGIILDTNVLSLLASADALSLLQSLAAFPLCVTPHIVQELADGVAQGISELRSVFVLITAEQIQVLRLTDTEQERLAHFPKKLAQGEREAIAVCQQRDMLFITRDRKAANYCDSEGVPCIRLHDLLVQFIASGLLTEQQAAQILT